MRVFKRSIPVLTCVAIAALVAACGGGTNGTTSSGGIYGNSSAPTASATARTGQSIGASVVRTGSAPVKGQTVTVLTDSNGATLYYFDHDTSSTVACMGSCAQAWPPLKATGATVTAPAGVSGTFSVVQGADGAQVEYNGHPLYTYTGDSAVGQANGDGVGGVWHVALPTTPASNGTGNGGYGG